MTETRLLFCPFCKEAFEGQQRCPSHDLQLVTLRELGALAAVQDDDTGVPLWSPKRGRGAVLAGALLTLIAFLLPLARLSGDVHATNTLLSAARGRALRLWIVPLAALAVLLILYRRRSGPSMRGARLALLFVSVLPSAVVAFTLRGASQAAHLLAAHTQSDVRLEIGLGAWLVWAACPLLLWGSARFGVRKSRRLR